MISSTESTLCSSSPFIKNSFILATRSDQPGAMARYDTPYVDYQDQNFPQYEHMSMPFLEHQTRAPPPFVSASYTYAPAAGQYMQVQATQQSNDDALTARHYETSEYYSPSESASYDILPWLEGIPPGPPPSNATVPWDAILPAPLRIGPQALDSG